MDIDDDIIQNLNIELLENVSGKGKDFPYIFRNLPLVIKSLNALIQLLKKLDTADDCIVNLPQVEEILSSLITNKILLLNPEAVSCIVQCLFEYSKIFKNENKNNDFITNINLSNSQIWCIQRIRTLMISTEFPRTKYIRQLEESMKALEYTPTEFYEEIVKEQVSVLKSYIALNKNEKHSVKNINEILDLCVYMLDSPTLILPLIEELIITSDKNLTEVFIVNVVIGPKNVYHLLTKKAKKKLKMEYTIVHEQEIVNTCQRFLSWECQNPEPCDLKESLSQLKEHLSNSLLVEILIEAIEQKNENFLQEFIIIFCNLEVNLNFIKITHLFHYLLSIIKSKINWNYYISIIEKIFPLNLEVLFEALKNLGKDISNKDNLNGSKESFIELFKCLTSGIKQTMALIPIFSESLTTSSNPDHSGYQKSMAEDVYHKQNINYQKMYHEFKMKNWIWFWMNCLFPEVKSIALRKLSQFIVRNPVNHKDKENKMVIDGEGEDGDREEREIWEAIDLYVDYLQLAILLETQDEYVTFPHYPVTLLDDLLPSMKEILPGPGKIEINHPVISTFSKKLIENPLLSTTISSELIIQILNEYFTINSYTFDQTISFYIEMEKVFKNTTNGKHHESMQLFLNLLWYHLFINR